MTSNMNTHTLQKEKNIQLSIHYYVLLLSDHRAGLYEGFRDKLIDIQNSNFPYEFPDSGNSATKAAPTDTQIKQDMEKIDQRFEHYFKQDPLHLVLVGKQPKLTAFESLQSRKKIIAGMIEGDYDETSPRDLGKIVWSVIKEAIAGKNKNALLDLAAASKTKTVISGIEAVEIAVALKPGATLFVEEDYQVKGDAISDSHSLILTEHFKFLDILDDTVDLVIEKVLKMGGTAIFLNNGALKKFNRIALIVSNGKI